MRKQEGIRTVSGHGSSMTVLIYQWTVLLFLLAVTLVPSFVIGWSIRPSIEGWYRTLRKPSWTPPGWLFGPVWTVLYIAMSVACWLVWREDPGATLCFRLFAAQLILNHAWSLLFFWLKKPGLAFAELVVLWAFILATTASFALRVPLAAQLMLPYLAWVSFAGLLNFRIWRDNR